MVADFDSLNDYITFLDVDEDGNLAFRVIKKNQRKNVKKKKQKK